MKQTLSVVMIIMVSLTGVINIDAKKIKNTLIIEKSKGKDSSKDDSKFPGEEILLTDSFEEGSVKSILRKVSFAGYDKEVASSKESFIISNPTYHNITGFEVKINYLDMKGRMLHSRTIRKECDVPAGESRRVDIPTWDTQRTYYYHLGNEPKKVATPYQVSFIPVSFWIDEKTVD